MGLWLFLLALPLILALPSLGFYLIQTEEKEGLKANIENFIEISW